jgi:hypothetical protein
LEIKHAVTPSNTQKAALDALHQAILAAQAELNVYLTERKLEEDKVNGVANGRAQKRKAEDEDADEDGEEEADDDED